MIQILHGFDPTYYLDTESGNVYSENIKAFLTPYGFEYTLKTATGEAKKISKKKLVYLVTGREWAIDLIQDLPGEVWKEIEGIGVPGRYWVSSLGRVKSYTKNYAQTVNPYDHNGYKKIKLYNGSGQRISVFIHDLVAVAFIGPAPSACHAIHHKDFTRDNNASSNLQWVDPWEHAAIHREHREKHKEEQKKSE